MLSFCEIWPRIALFIINIVSYDGTMSRSRCISSELLMHSSPCAILAHVIQLVSIVFVFHCEL